MNTFTGTFFISALLSCSWGYAALPPLYETLREFRSLIEDPRLAKSFTSGEAIVKIEREEQQFTVTSNKSAITVQVEYEPADMPGPQRFRLIFDTKSEENME